MFIPVIGALAIGLMAKFGSSAIRGHGIPEAMEQVLTNESRIPLRVTFLKPLSSAISIGTGGPFGAEGPIIATGGALGSAFGQLLPVTTAERKTLLAAGAAAGMAATFGAPVSAVLLAIELLLFEFHRRSIIPVALAAAAATSVRMAFEGVEPMFAMPNLQQPPGTALLAYVILGGICGVLAVGVTKCVYGIEDLFERLPVHWMWWPALGSIVVGVIGFWAPETLGVGYDSIKSILANRLTMQGLIVLCILKFISWSISLGSGTSGGTLAPLFMIGGGLGGLLGTAANHLIPGSGIDPRIAALVGMAAMFTGASRAMLASVVFAFETTLQPLGLLPLLGGCAAANLSSNLLMRNSIMTEKIMRRGVRAPAEYEADVLDQVHVHDIMASEVVFLQSAERLEDVRARVRGASAAWSHQGFPVLDNNGKLLGVVTRREILAASNDSKPTISELIQTLPKVVFDDCTARQAVDHMVNHGIGRLPVVSRGEPTRVVGSRAPCRLRRRISGTVVCEIRAIPSGLSSRSLHDATSDLALS